jgi:CDP-6-deoxy-D-xylo-4-hexulose-3-dehydrase
MINLVSDTIDSETINLLIDWLSQKKIPKLTKGDLTIKLESLWAKKIGTKYSVYVNSGSSSILLTLTALLYSGKLKNKKIIVPGLSWATDISSPIILGFTPIMCDCNLHDLSCDINHLEKLFIEHEPSTLILVSALGLVPDMDKILDLCKKYDVILLEDVCESMGSKYKNDYLGSFGFASFFSLYFGHHLSTIEGGFINTNDDEFYHLLLMMRSHGWDRDLPIDEQKKIRKKYNINDFDSLYTFYVPGYNLRSTDLQAFIGINSLNKLDSYAKKRNENFKEYLSKIKNNMLVITESNYNFISNFAFPVLSKNKEEIINDLRTNNIEVRPLIAGNMSKKPMWYNSYEKVNLPNCELVDMYGFYIPNHHDITIENINDISNIINKHF